MYTNDNLLYQCMEMTLQQAEPSSQVFKLRLSLHFESEPFSLNNQY